MRYIIVALLLAAPAYAAQPAPDWMPELQPVLLQVVTKSPFVRERIALSRHASEMAQSAGAQPNPSIFVGIQGLPVDGDPTREAMTQIPMIGIRQNFQSWGRGSQLAASLERQSDARRKSAWLLSNQQAAFLATLVFQREKYRQDLAYTTETVKWYVILVDAIEAKYRSGTGIRQAAELVRVEIGRLRISLSKILAGLKTVDAQWHAIAGEGMPEQLTATSRPPVWTPPNAKAEYSPSVQMRNSQADAANAQLVAAQRNWLPAMFLEVGYGMRGANRKDLLHAKLGFTAPLWGGAKNRAAVASESLAVEAAEIRKLGELWQVDSNLEDMKYQLLEGGQQLTLFHEELVPGATAARDSAAAAYETSQADIESLVKATDTLLGIHIAYSATLLNQRKLEAQYLAELGQLVPETRIGEPK